MRFLSSVKDFILDILFPEFCLICGREGSYLCRDCQSLTPISSEIYQGTKNLAGLYWAAPYGNFVVKKAINQFKYPPYIRELAKPLSFLIISHLLSAGNLDFSNFILVPVPLHKKKLKKRGFNQAEELAKELSKFLRAPVLNDVLVKIKKTPAQAELKKEQREENIKGAFFCREPGLLQGRKILLVDDVFTTGSTMEEIARLLREAGAKQVWGAVVARG